jgi:hypothetical protein
MMLIIWYVVFVAIGTALAYFSGLFVEFEGWGSNASMIVFLTIYFLSLWIGWVIAVRVTEPKKLASEAGIK